MLVTEAHRSRPQSGCKLPGHSPRVDFSLTQTPFLRTVDPQFCSGLHVDLSSRAHMQNRTESSLYISASQFSPCLIGFVCFISLFGRQYRVSEIWFIMPYRAKLSSTLAPAHRQLIVCINSIDLNLYCVHFSLQTVTRVGHLNASCRYRWDLDYRHSSQLEGTLTKYPLINRLA